MVEERQHLQIGRLIYRSDAATFWQRLHETLERSGARDFRLPKDIHEASLLFDSPAQPMLELLVARQPDTF